MSASSSSIESLRQRASSVGHSPDMAHPVSRLLIRSVLAGLLLVLLAIQPAFAVEWGAEVKLSSTNTSDHELVRTGPRTALILWQRGSALLVRRTLDGGTTWLPTQTMATSIGLGTSVAAYGNLVDVAYVRSVICPDDGQLAWRLFHRRSLDGGATWRPPVALTSACSEVAQADIARSGDGQVSVVWVGLFTGRILMRTSRDGGATFGAAVHVASTTAMDRDTIPGSTGSYRADPEVAIGSGGTTYVAYTASVARNATVAIRRSLNRGQTWSAPRTISTAAVSVSSLVADGARAVVGYTTTTSSMRAVYRTTTDRGATWSAGRAVITVQSGGFSTEPEFAYQAGVLAVIVKQGRPGASPVWHRQSTNWGSTWTAATRASVAHPGGRADPEPAGLAILDGEHLAGYAENGDATGLWVHRGTP